MTLESCAGISSALPSIYALEQDVSKIKNAAENLARSVEGSDRAFGLMLLARAISVSSGVGTFRPGRDLQRMVGRASPVIPKDAATEKAVEDLLAEIEKVIAALEDYQERTERTKALPRDERRALALTALSSRHSPTTS